MFASKTNIEIRFLTMEVCSLILTWLFCVSVARDVHKKQTNVSI